MNVSGKTYRLTALALLVFGLGLVVTVNFTEACKLRAVTIDGKPVADWQKRFPLLSEAPIVSQPVDQLADALLKDEDVYKVDISFHLPGEIDIRTNEFKPVCFVLGQETGKLFGLNRRARLIALDQERIDWEQPVLTGVATGSLHSFSRDPRVLLVIDQLEVARRSRADLFRLIDEIDFSSHEHLRVSIAGLPYSLLVRPDRLVDDLDRFVSFTGNYETDLTGVIQLDLRYDEMVICALSDKEMKARAEAKKKAKAEAEAMAEAVKD